MTDEAVFSRPVNSNPVNFSTRAFPERRVLTGSVVQLEPLDPVRHGDALYRAGHDNDAALRSWEYLPWGPFPSEDAMREQFRKFAASPDLVYFAICDRTTSEAFGKATYLDIHPEAGAIEIGGIWFAPKYQRTLAATEAIFLLLAYAMDDLGYRRMQWRCNARNAKSRAAARRLGFRFEGIWFNHMIVKGLNRDTAWYSILDSEWPAVRASIRAWLDAANFNAAGNQQKSLSSMTAEVR
jgi:RimJ/RimL family protein N-acetyltransferase